MTTKVGAIVGWGRAGPKFVEALLQGGERVELPLAMRGEVDQYPAGWPLVFVERRGRLFGYVQWMGSPQEALNALQSGILRPHEITADVRMNAAAIEAVIAEPARRAGEALEMIEASLPSDSRTSIAAYRSLIESLLLLDEIDLDRIREAHEVWLNTGRLIVMSAISRDALGVGYAVRWVRWPNPIDPTENSNWRARIDDAAIAVEWAAAALAEPALSDVDVADAYSQLEVAIPRSKLRLAGACA